MNAKKFYYIMIGVIVVLVCAGFGGVFISNKLLQKQSAKLVGLKLESRLLEEQQTALIQANRDIEKYTELERIAKSIVPQDKDQARTILEITQFAQLSGIRLKSITFPASNLGQAQPKAATAEQGAAATPATPLISQVKPVEGIPGVYALEVNIQSVDNNAASYASFLDFLNRLEQNRRTAQVTNISIKPSTTSPGSLSFTLIANVYIKP